MTEWVSVTERLPDDLDTYYVWDGENVQCAYHCDDQPASVWEDPELGDRGGGVIDNVTHWFPHPEPPGQ